MSGGGSVYTFLGKEDPGVGMLDFGPRYYNAMTGRFLSPDPILAGASAYAYCAGNPIMLYDPSGMYAIPPPPRGPENLERIATWGMDPSEERAMRIASASGVSRGIGNVWLPGEWVGGFFAVDPSMNRTYLNEPYAIGRTINGNVIAGAGSKVIDRIVQVYNEYEKSKETGKSGVIASTGKHRDLSRAYRKDPNGQEMMWKSGDVPSGKEVLEDVNLLGHGVGGMFGEMVCNDLWWIQKDGRVRLVSKTNLNNICFRGSFDKAAEGTKVFSRIAKWSGAVGVGFALYDFGSDPSYGRALDVAVTCTFMFPGFGWAVAGSYSLANMIVLHYTGQTIGMHAEQTVRGWIK